MIVSTTLGARLAAKFMGPAALAAWRVVGWVVCVGLVVGSAFHAGRVFEGRTRDAAALQQAQADLSATRDAAAENQRLQARQTAGATGATNATITQLRAAAAAGYGARDERERLRDQVAELEHRLTQASDAEPACGTDAAGATSLHLLDECAGRYQALAGDAGQLAATVTGLQRWVSGVCTDQVRPEAEGGRLDQ